jgi:hypothetical protein
MVGPGQNTRIHSVHMGPNSLGSVYGLDPL